MEGKVIKRLAMLSLLSVFTLCAAVASANAQLSMGIRAKIPFDFTVGNRKLAAGEYKFSRLSDLTDNRMMLVSSVDSSTRMFQLTLAAHVLTPKNTTLVFHKYGDQYFLKQIWTQGEQDCTELLESSSERTIRRQLVQTQQSNLSGKMTKAETIEIVATLF
jgi:hypothetical protein